MHHSAGIGVLFFFFFFHVIIWVVCHRIMKIDCFICLVDAGYVLVFKGYVKGPHRFRKCQIVSK